MFFNSSPPTPIDGWEDDVRGMDYFFLHPELTIPYLALLCVLTLVGNVGNIMVIGAVIADKRLRTKSTYDFKFQF